MVNSLVATGRGRERLVLAAGMGSAVALAWVAFASTGSPDAAGELAVARLAGEVATGVAEEWERMRQDPVGAPGPWVPLGERFEWTGAETQEPAAAEPNDLRAQAANEPESSMVYSTLLREAEQLDRDGKAEVALATVLEALADAPSPAARAEGRLRAIQIAARRGQGDVVRAQWAAGLAELGPRDARGDTAYLLLYALAAAPALDETDRGEIVFRIAEFWDRGVLALPPETDRLVRTDDPVAYRVLHAPSVAALRERLDALSPTASISISLARDTAERRIRALAEGLDGLPVAEAGAGWLLTQRPIGTFAVRARAGEFEGFFVDPLAVEGELARRAALPDGFHLDFTGDAADAGEVVRARTALAGAGLDFELRHVDPSALARAERDRLFLVRTGLLVLAVFSALASLATFRALARGRRLTELKSSFIAGVSHDLRTPLASILLMAENLEHGLVKEESARKRYFASIRREADRLRRLVDDVLDFSRIERGEAPRLQAQDVLLGPFLDELESELEERATRSEVGFRFERGELPPSAMLDAEAVRRAAWNLVDNALKHSGAKNIGVRIQIQGPPDGHALSFAVEDDGCGVPEAKREEIFRPFSRLTSGSNGGSNASTGGSVTGTGLGLAIVREVARAHSGSASVRARTDGPGSVFELSLDLAAGSGGRGMESES